MKLRRTAVKSRFKPSIRLSGCMILHARTYLRTLCSALKYRLWTDKQMVSFHNGGVSNTFAKYVACAALQLSTLEATCTKDNSVDQWRRALLQREIRKAPCLGVDPTARRNPADNAFHRLGSGNTGRSHYREDSESCQERSLHWSVSGRK